MKIQQNGTKMEKTVPNRLILNVIFPNYDFSNWPVVNSENGIRYLKIEK